MKNTTVVIAGADPRPATIAEEPMTQTDLTVRMITVDCDDPARLASFWSAATGSPVVADHGEFVMVGSSPALGFQRVDDRTPGKNRLHLDLGGPDREETVRRLVGLGASEHDTCSVPGLTWTVLSDPEGNVFCVGNPDR